MRAEHQGVLARSQAEQERLRAEHEAFAWKATPSRIVFARSTKVFEENTSAFASNTIGPAGNTRMRSWIRSVFARNTRPSANASGPRSLPNGSGQMRSRRRNQARR